MTAALQMIEKMYNLIKFFSDFIPGSLNGLFSNQKGSSAIMRYNLQMSNDAPVKFKWQKPQLFLLMPSQIPNEFLI